MKTIILMGNNKKVLELLGRILEGEGYFTLVTGFDAEALDLMETIQADMLIIDASIKGVDSVRLIEDTLTQREDGIPVLVIADKSVISACQNNPVLTDCMPGFLCKPIVPDELGSRVRQLFRDQREGRKATMLGNISLDANSSLLKTPTAAIPLSRKEFSILQKLLTKPHNIFTREEILEAAWGIETEADIRTVDVHIKRLRAKLEGIGELRIGTVRGVGYKAWVAG